MIDYYIHSLVICMNKKYHNQDLEIDGLTYKRMYSKTNDIDYEKCMKLLLKYRADTNAELIGK